ncbi:hypothetical protein JET76_22335 [Pseudomonas putida]|uniref:hypothetical protein n=1 Tax=Pseudomonas putida TaxID=303 RepID=UPI0018E6D1C4|nr:hypothetical protein [Pseudomonas putida]MBI6944073.1 hypothetical protein [Pseudomonas putida]MBI6960153.1 hypothetical protein [Pseudomonas putida]
MSEQNEILELILTAEVLSLAAAIKAAKAARGIQTTSDCVSDAVREIKSKKAKVIELLRGA